MVFVRKYIYNYVNVVIKVHRKIISHNELTTQFYSLFYTRLYFSVHPVLLKSIIKPALRLTASNTTFGCNPYLQNIDVMKNKDVELTDWNRVLEKREKDREKRGKVQIFLFISSGYNWISIITYYCLFVLELKQLLEICLKTGAFIIFGHRKVIIEKKRQWSQFLFGHRKKFIILETIFSKRYTLKYWEIPFKAFCSIGFT